MKRVSLLLIKHVVYSYKNISDIVFCIKFAFKDNTFDGPKAMGRDPYGPTSIEMVTLITVSVPHDRRFGRFGSHNSFWKATLTKVSYLVEHFS